MFWPERSYKWGTSEAFNPEHSDLLYLRQLLLEEACEEIAAAKRHRCADIPVAPSPCADVGGTGCRQVHWRMEPSCSAVIES